MKANCLLRVAVACALGAMAASGHAVQPIAAPTPPCAAVRALVVIDDQVQSPAWIQDLLRVFRVGSPAAAVRAALEGKPCLALLDADPVFASIPGAAVPELVVRIRALELKGAERNFARRASEAVGRYMSSYLGHPGETVPVLREVELGGELLCARSRNLLQSASAKGASADEATSEDNRKRVDDAAGQLAGLLIKLINEAPLPCTARAGDLQKGEAERQGALSKDEEKSKGANKDTVERP